MAANRIASAYWHDRNPEFYEFMLNVFRGVVEHTPNPVPPGIFKEKYLNDHYPNFLLLMGTRGIRP